MRSETEYQQGRHCTRHGTPLWQRDWSPAVPKLPTYYCPRCEGGEDYGATEPVAADLPMAAE